MRRNPVMRGPHERSWFYPTSLLAVDDDRPRGEIEVWFKRVSRAFDGKVSLEGTVETHPVQDGAWFQAGWRIHPHADRPRHDWNRWGR